ncbi:hypothetical protein C2845_PM07G05650 [Panicum miliaceum]|uniref:Rx N-terminal domain-containing protein n=1 Tax=Panicum miliaceum TaxID=4540 RepID=A0A3L6SNC5_PANMI|nr:hypothetical protein C2845_PM07G05650 [Panicum miliaceum]
MFIIDELEMMQSFLNVASEERAKNNVVRTWVRQVRDLAFGVEDDIEFVVHLVRSTRWWRRLLPPAAALRSLEEAAAAKIMLLKARAEGVSQRNSRYSFIISNSGSEPVMKRQSATTKEQEDLWGLTQLITMEENSDLRVISMCGAGGDLDRATVLKKFYQDAQVRQNFECRGWIKLTYPFNPHTFLQSLVIQFYKNACLQQETSTDLAELRRMERTEAKQGEIIEEFMKQVHGKRYLLILENVYTVAEWEAIRVCLPDNKKGNWVIISTDQHEIASLCIQHSYQVLALEHYPTEYPLYVFFKEGSQVKETRRVLSINDGTASRKAVACRWMDHFSLVGLFGSWESFFISEGMKVLRVLDLENATGVTDEDLKQMVKILPRLKFLSLRGSTGIYRLPSSLRMLLETLDIRGTSIVTLPESITKIKKLRYMRAGSIPLANESPTTFSSPSCGHCHPVGVVLPTGIDILTALHTLGVVNTGHAAGKVTLKELMKITRLRKLGVTILCKNLQSLKLYGLVRGVPVWMKYLPKLTKLDLHITISPEVDIIKALAEIEELCILRLCVKPLQDSDGVLNFDVKVNGIQQPCYLKVKIFEITCSSNLNVSFGSEAMQNLELLTARCISRSRLKFFEIKDLSKLKLKEIRLIDSDGNAIKDMERQLMEHPRKPLLKLEAPDRC